MSQQSQQHGAFSWFELMTSDVRAAKAFYSGLFGWKFDEMSVVPGMDYSVVKVADQGVGGVMKTPPEAQGMPPTWGVYVTVDDVDATAQAAEKLGGQLLVPPRDIPNVGRFCVIQDPQGAWLSAITYAKHGNPEAESAKHRAP